MWKRVAIGAAVALIVVGAITWLMVSIIYAVSGDPRPLNDVEMQSFRLWIVASIALGVLAKLLFDYFSSVTESEFFQVSLRSFTFRSVKSVVLASIASPLVLSSILHLLKDVNDLSLTCLVCFQNGFFFQSILSFPHQRRTAKGRAAQTRTKG